MNYGAYRPCPKPRRADYYCPKPQGYPTLPGQPIPVIEGQFINHAPYPAREAPELPQATESPVSCPQGSEWSWMDRVCRPTPDYSGLGQYIDPGVARRWEWDSFGVGIGAMAGTMGLGMIASLIIQGANASKTRTDLSLLPSLVPGIGAGVIAYLLRWHTNNCVCGQVEPQRQILQQETPSMSQRTGYVQKTPRGEVVTEDRESDFI